MPKRVKKPSSDPNRAAFQSLQAIIAMTEPDDKPPIQAVSVKMLPPTMDQISQVMSELGRRGGKVSGARRKKNLSEAERKRIAAMGGRKKAENARKAKRRARQATAKPSRP